MKKIHSHLFLTAHLGSIPLRLVLETTQMQHSVGNHPEQLLLKSHPELDGILAHPFDTDINVAVELVTLHIVERDDVGERVVLKVLEVKLEEILIIAKDIVDISYFLTMVFSQTREPPLILHLVGQIKRRFRMEKNHKKKFRQKYRKKGKWGGRKIKKLAYFCSPKMAL